MGHKVTKTYTRWKHRWFMQMPRRGSRWFYGNFGCGLLVDSHPRFVTIAICLLVVEFGISFTRKPRVVYAGDRVYETTDD